MSAKLAGQDSSAAKEGKTPWIAVDFDRTTCTYTAWDRQGEEFGTPILPTLARIKGWMKMGYIVKIFTARAASSSPRRDRDIAAIRAWCLKHLGVELEVTAEKDFACVMIVDDLAFPVLRNVGSARLRGDVCTAFLPVDPLDSDAEFQLIDADWEHATYMEAECES